MKLGRFAINAVKYKVVLENKHRYRHQVFDSKYNPKPNIPYIDDKKDHHKFDLFFAPNNVDKKRCLVIDIHGGAYIFGHRRENYNFGTVFLNAGFDFASIDYIPNDGRHSVNDLIDQCVKCVTYIVNHFEELGLEKDYPVVLTGDSAGGHLASTLAELFSNPEYAKELGYELPPLNLKALLINCPVFGFNELGDEALTKSGRKRLFGPEYNNLEKRALIDPAKHIESLKVPLFVSTSKNDFMRPAGAESALKAMEGRPNKFQYLYLEDEDAGHVHNILDIKKPCSIRVNQAMIDFINEAIK